MVELCITKVCPGSLWVRYFALMPADQSTVPDPGYNISLAPPTSVLKHMVFANVIGPVKLSPVTVV